MKLAWNTYRARLCHDEYVFAKQCGCKGIITGLVDFNMSWIGGKVGGVPVVRQDDPIWEYDSLAAIAKEIRAEGLEWYGIENFNPADWYDVLLDGSEKHKQMDRLKKLIADVGKIGIPYFGYNFSLTGVYGRVLKSVCRGGATSMCFDGSNPDCQIPIPNGEIWNTVYDENAPKGNVPIISNQELWERCKWFLEQILPVAEEAGVMMCAHPDDPPVERMRGNARLIHKLDMFQRLVDLVPSDYSGVELCMGTMQEMDDPAHNIYEIAKSLAEQKKIAYVHLRNVKGKVPYYEERFIDEGDLDIVKALTVLRDAGYDGPVVPDHVPNMTASKDDWGSSNAFALGYIKAVMKMIGAES